LRGYAQEADGTMYFFRFYPGIENFVADGSEPMSPAVAAGGGSALPSAKAKDGGNDSDQGRDRRDAAREGQSKPVPGILREKRKPQATETAEIGAGAVFVFEGVEFSRDQLLEISGTIKNQGRKAVSVYAGVTRDMRYDATPHDQDLQATATDAQGNRYVYQSSIGFKTEYKAGVWDYQAGADGYLGKRQFVIVEPGESAPVSLHLAPTQPVNAFPEELKISVQFRVLSTTPGSRPVDKTVRFKR
jgi:hypothetical protein